MVDFGFDALQVFPENQNHLEPNLRSTCISCAQERPSALPAPIRLVLPASTWMAVEERRLARAVHALLEATEPRQARKLFTC